MKVRTALLSIAAAAVLSAAIALPTIAATANRYSVQMAAGACQPFFSTTQARYSAGGLLNGGNAMFYAVCSMAGTWEYDSTNGGASFISIHLRNTTPEPVAVACTARPGYVFGIHNFQSAYPKSTIIPANGDFNFNWDSTSFGGRFRNPNFTCTVRPGIEIQLVERNYTEEVGAL